MKQFFESLVNCCDLAKTFRLLVTGMGSKLLRLSRTLIVSTMSADFFAPILCVGAAGWSADSACLPWLLSNCAAVFPHEKLASRCVRHKFITREHQKPHVLRAKLKLTWWCGLTFDSCPRRLPPYSTANGKKQSHIYNTRNRPNTYVYIYISAQQATFYVHRYGRVWKLAYIQNGLYTIQLPVSSERNYAFMQAYARPYMSSLYSTGARIFIQCVPLIPCAITILAISIILLT